MNLRDYQDDALHHAYLAETKEKLNRLLVAMPTGTGKAQPLDEPVLTPIGFRPIGDLQPGQRVIGSLGMPTVVESVHPQGRLPIYEVSISDGTTVRCSLEHLWDVQTKDAKCERRGWKTMTTAELLQRGLSYSDGSAKWFLPVVKPVQFAKRRLPVHPYLLGALLGDGCFRNGNVNISSVDRFILNKIRDHLPPGHSIKPVGGCDYQIVTGGKHGKLKKNLWAMGLRNKYSWEKHIPRDYLLSDVGSRIQVLRGLMDTDGTVSKHGHAEFCSTSQQLCEDVAFLVRSLGGCTRIRDRKTPSYTHKGEKKDGRPAWRVSVHLEKFNPFSIPRKQNRYKKDKKQGSTKSILAIKPVGFAECVCIKVAAPNSLYVTRDFNITHNTVVFGQWLNERKGRAIVLAHRDELIRQAVHKLKMILPPDVSIGVIKGEEHEPEAEVIVASVQSLHAKRLADIRGVQAIVVDEAHHSEAPTYQRILRTLGAFDGVMTLGVTATPFRGDGKDLSATWQKIVYHMDIRDAIKAGHLCGLRAYRVSTRANFAKLKIKHGDFAQGQAGAELMAAGAPEQIADAVKQYAEGRPTIIFCPTVEVSQEVEVAVRKHRACLHVDGTTDLGTRANARELLSKGGVVTNCGIYTEGFDAPEVSCIVVARPTKSQTLYVQMVGRGTRNHPGKDDCIILDVVGATMRHELCTASILAVGASEEEKRAAEIVKRRNMVHGIAERTAGPIAAVEIDLWGQRPFNWIKTGVGYLLSVGTAGNLLLAQDGDQWAVWQKTGDDTRKLWKGNDLGYGQGWAEDWVRERGLQKLCRKDADWRHDPCTKGQQITMTKLRINWTEHTTKGEASDAISWAFANRGRW